MIVIDGIYTNTFYPWFRENIPKTRMLFCDPPGDTSPASVQELFDNNSENYIFVHDQEPVHFDIYEDLFDEVVMRNLDLPTTQAAVIHSEYNSEAVRKLCNKYRWKDYYYFFHGWTALDWYRGYNKSTLSKQKDIQHCFMFPNNIIGGKRKHRLKLFAEIEKRWIVEDNLISLPNVCPYENQTAQQLIDKYEIFHDIKTKLPLRIDELFDNYASNSHEINMWEASSKTLVQVVSETLFEGDRIHITEKSFKPIVMQQPFIIAGNRGSLEYLRSYGFKTFDSVWDESYDQTDDNDRCSAIADLLLDLQNQDWNQLHNECLPIIEHNFNHFYNGGFEKILHNELQAMITQIKKDFA